MNSSYVFLREYYENILTFNRYTLQYLIVGLFGCSVFSWGNDSPYDSILTAPDVSIRYDAREGQSERTQYRVRWNPYWSPANTAWSIHGFAVTGNDFSSSYNTIDSDTPQRFYLRRLFIRQTHARGKWEFGVIPPYKGRVSSTGLSKDGWIKGARGVVKLVSNDKLEMVLGELKQLNTPGRYDWPEKIDYGELEFSSTLRRGFSYEFAFEYMLDDSFLRGELRQAYSNETEIAIEAVYKLDGGDTKWVAGYAAPLTKQYGGIRFFGYYSFVPEDFGSRAELTEEFPGFDHSLVIEIEGSLTKQLAWFSKAEHTTHRWRAQFGLAIRF